MTLSGCVVQISRMKSRFPGVGERILVAGGQLNQIEVVLVDILVSWCDKFLCAIHSKYATDEDRTNCSIKEKLNSDKRTSPTVRSGRDHVQARRTKLGCIMGHRSKGL